MPRLFTVLAVLALAWFLALCGLWVRSWYQREVWGVVAPDGRGVVVMNYAGRIAIGWRVFASQRTPGWRSSYLASPADLPPFPLPLVTVQAGGVGGWHGIPISVTLVLPGWWWWRRRQAAAVRGFDVTDV